MDSNKIQDSTDSNFPPISKDEIKARKNWLISFWLYYGPLLPWYLCFCGLMTYLFAAGVCKSKSCMLLNILLPILIIFCLALAIVPMLITYRCAYKKRGTAWLKWLMIIIPIKIVICVAPVPYRSMIPDQMKTATSEWLMYIFILIDLFFWVNCYKLYKFNKIHARNKLGAEKANECS